MQARTQKNQQEVLNLGESRLACIDIQPNNNKIKQF